MVDGLILKELKTTPFPPGAVTVAELLAEAPPYVPVTLTVVGELTAPATTETLPEDEPAGMKTADGTGRADALLDDKATCAPPVGAGPSKLSVTVAVAPLNTVVGLIEIPLIVAPDVVKLSIADQSPYC